MKRIHQLTLIAFQTVLIISLFSIVNAQTESDVPTGEQEEQPIETVTPSPTPPANPDASIKIVTIDGMGAPLAGIVYGCVDMDMNEEPVYGESIKSDASGQVTWNVVAEEGHTYTCSAVSGYPDCLVPPSDDQKQVTITDLEAGQNLEYNFVWVFDPDQPYQNSGLTCGEAVDRGELAPIASAVIPAGFKVTPDTTTMTLEESKSVYNLTIEYTAASSSIACSEPTANNKIQWVEPVDLSGDNMIAVFSTLNDYISLDKKGEINSTISSVSALAKTQKYFLTGLNFSLQQGKFPEIVIDGDYADLDKISNVGYNSNTLSFTANSGTIFAYRPTMEVLECNEDDIQDGKCVVTGKVDDVCASVIINVTGGMTLTESVKVSSTGDFSYELTGLERGNKYNVNLTAKSTNLEKTEKSWVIGEDSIVDDISGNAIVILGFLILIIGLIGALWYKKHQKKHAVMAMSVDEQKEKARKVIADVRKLSEDLKNEVGTLDLQDKDRVAQFQKITEMANEAAELETMINVPEEGYDNNRVGEKLHALEIELEDFRKVLVQEVAVKKFGEQVQETQPQSEVNQSQPEPVQPQPSQVDLNVQSETTEENSLPPVPEGGQDPNSTQG